MLVAAPHPVRSEPDVSSKANAETLRAYSCSHANDCCAALTYRHFYNCHGLLTLLWECSCSCVTVEQLLATKSEISTTALISLWPRTSLPTSPSRKRGALVSQHVVDRRWILMIYEGAEFWQLLGFSASNCYYQNPTTDFARPSPEHFVTTTACRSNRSLA